VRARWASELRERARGHWTSARFRSAFGDKQLLVHPAEAPELLRGLGLMNADATISPDRIRKVRQINHLLAVVRPALDELIERHPTVRIVDAGCGRSALSLLVAWWFRQRGHPADVLAIDRDAGLLEAAKRSAEVAGLDVRYRAAELATVDAEMHGLLALHACDTATDDAIALGVERGADFVAVAPCCQRELSAAWAALADHPMAALWDSPHLRRAAAATVTDAFRLWLLRARGYEASATEFVEAVHTPKNTLIRAMKRAGPDPAAWQRFEALKAQTGGATIALEARLRGR